MSQRLDQFIVVQNHIPPQCERDRISSALRRVGQIYPSSSRPIFQILSEHKEIQDMPQLMPDDCVHAFY